VRIAAFLATVLVGAVCFVASIFSLLRRDFSQALFFFFVASAAGPLANRLAGVRSGHGHGLPGVVCSRCGSSLDSEDRSCETCVRETNRAAFAAWAREKGGEHLAGNNETKFVDFMESCYDDRRWNGSVNDGHFLDWVTAYAALDLMSRRSPSDNARS
jgi:hypothetical protein